MIERAMTHLRRIFTRSPWAAEMWSALTCIAWGAAVIAAPQAITTWPPVSYLITVAPHQYWGVLAIVLGTLQFIAVALDLRWGRWGSGVTMAWFWGVLTLAAADAAVWLPSIAVYGGWAGVNFFSTIRLLRPGG